jgi:drug/metabolite transporter (DMT)-like permease
VTGVTRQHSDTGCNFATCFYQEGQLLVLFDSKKACLACLFLFERVNLKLRIWIPLLAIYLIWGSTYLAIRFAIETIPPFLMAATRFLIPGILLFVWRRSAGDPIPSRLEWKSTIIIGLLLLVGGNGGVTWAEQYVPSGVAALIIGSVPLWIILLNLFRPEGRRMNKYVIFGVIVGFVGIALLIGPSQLIGTSEVIHPIGIIAILSAAIFWSAGSLYSRNATMPASPLLSTGMEFLAGGIGLLVMSALTGEFTRFNFQAISTRSMLSMIYLMIFGSLIAFVAYTWLLRNAPITLVSTYAYVNPLIAILIGNRLAHETLNLRILIAAAIIISSVFLINTTFMRNPANNENKVLT